MRVFEEIFRPTAATTILDVGGGEYNWTLISTQPKVTLINTYYGPGSNSGPFSKILGDGRLLPFADKSFDIVYSNSVIEHVGSFDDQAAFASEVKRVGKAYFVQTPDRYFPVEPHFVAPFIHYLPVNLQMKLIRHFTPWGLITKPDRKRVEQTVASIQLLTCSQMKNLFADARILRERLCGLSKSLIAIKEH
jgi:hypothetical protein